MRTWWAVLGAAMLTAASCGARAGGPPAIEVDRTACGHCGMLVSEPRYAAAYRAAGAEPRVFDDIACLREAARTEPGPLTFWFHDANAGVWIEGERAVFVASPRIRTPMGGGLVAHGDRMAAEQSASEHEGRVIRSLSELLAGRTGS